MDIFLTDFLILTLDFLLAKEQKSESAIHSFFERIALLRFFKERRERIAHDCSLFMHDLSESIMSFFCKERL